MNFLVVSAERAERIKARWWAAARLELKWWLITFIITCVVLGALSGAPAWVVGLFGMIELIFISRIALWSVIIVAFAAWIIGSAAYALGRPIYAAEPISIAFAFCTLVIMIRFIWWISHGRRIA